MSQTGTGEGEQDGFGEDTIITRALGGGARVKILYVFLGDYDRGLNATEVSEQAGVDRATFYRHIGDLRAWGLVERANEVGQSRLYKLDTESEAAKKLAGFEWELIQYLAEKEEAGEVNDKNQPVLADDEGSHTTE